MPMELLEDARYVISTVIKHHALGRRQITSIMPLELLEDSRYVTSTAEKQHAVENFGRLTLRD